MSSPPAWDDSYRAGSPAPWDIGRPQPAFSSLVLSGSVLDAGCGTGEHALMAAAQGCEVLGIDIAPTAIDVARAKALERELCAEFLVADALRFDTLGRSFDVVLDCGLFHTFDESERERYVAGLAEVCRGTVHLLCFSDAAGSPPQHGFSEAEVREAFADGWRIAALEPSLIHTNLRAPTFPAWLARIERRAIR